VAADALDQCCACVCQQFYVDRECAMISGTIKVLRVVVARVRGGGAGVPNAGFSCSGPFHTSSPPHRAPPSQAMLSGSFLESKGGEIQFPEIKSVVLEKVIQYMYYKVKQNCTGEIACALVIAR